MQLYAYIYISCTYVCVIMCLCVYVCYYMCLCVCVLQCVYVDVGESIKKLGEVSEP